MRGDFSRLTFRPAKHFSGVRLQQGRVQLDADWNEQADIHQHLDETRATDVVGRTGGPIGGAGFALTCDGGDIAAGCPAAAIRIGAGRYYVDGLLCENERVVALGGQPDLPGVALPTAPGTYLAYLDVWRRHLTALEDPDLREVALGGPDTATRLRTVWQVRLHRAGDADSCLDFSPPWVPDGAASTGRLRARASLSPPPINECLVPASGGYRRIENQLYRVEIHTAGPAGTARYKWSRDNGSVAATLEDIQGTVVTISGPSKETEDGFADARFVELTDEARTLRGEAGILVPLASVQGTTLTVTAWPGTPPSMADFGARPIVRRWESAATPAQQAMAELEDGVEVEFDAGDYRVGDYWTIPARSVDGSVLWPVDAGQPVFERRHGIDHRYAPLALLRLDGSGAWKLASDCRRLFPALTDLTVLFFAGGDGQEAKPDPAAPSALLPLARPLRAGVANGRHPVAGATVRFRVVDGGGRLNGGTGPATVVTGADGVAECRWEIDSTTQIQQVEAALLDAEASVVHVPIRFTANLSVASEVAYFPGACANLAGVKTVQQALERLGALATLLYMGGDGQEAMPGEPLRPLQVRVLSDCGPVGKARVRFEAAPGNGTLQGAGPVADVPTDAQGVATCTWQLDLASATQHVTATLLDAAGHPIAQPAAIVFTANLSIAGRVAYDPKKCETLAGVRTVEEALDRLCAEPAVRIRRVRLVGTADDLRNDTTVAAPALRGGIDIVCDGELDPASLAGKPVCFLTVEVPYPLTDADRQFWGPAFVGFQPVVVGATVRGAGDTVAWRPTDPAAAWLADVSRRVAARGGKEPVLARLTLKGNFVWARGEDRLLYVDGEAFGFPERDGTTAVLRRRPSGDGRRGGDFEMWFTLVPG